MDTRFAGRKRKLSDVSDSRRIKLSENNDHRPKLKSRKHENGLAHGLTANVVGTKKQNKTNENCVKHNTLEDTRLHREQSN